MGIPTHFGSSIIQRTVQLLNEFEPEVGKGKGEEFGGPLTTTFLLGIAMPLLVIPMERYLRARADRPQYEVGISDRIAHEMRAELDKPFENTAFYVGGSWVEARHVLPFVHPLGWTDDFHKTLFNGAGSKLARQSSALELVTFLRHALAHGAIA